MKADADTLRFNVLRLLQASTILSAVLSAAGCAVAPGGGAAAAAFIEIQGQQIAYRSIGEGEPIVLLQRFRGTMDDWDPAFLSALAAKNRRVIVFDNVGVGQSAGEVPKDLETAADAAAAFIRAVGLQKTAVLGWSMGGMTAQILAVRHPELVSHLILAGTAPAAGSPEVLYAPQSWIAVATKPSNVDDDILFLFFADTETSKAAGRQSLARMTDGAKRGSAGKTSIGVMQAQAQAVRRFGKNEGGWYQRLKEVKAPTLVANGDRDRAFPAIDSIVLAREIPRSQLAVYPNAGHAFHFQYPERFADDVDTFIRTN